MLCVRELDMALGVPIFVLEDVIAACGVSDLLQVNLLMKSLRRLALKAKREGQQQDSEIKETTVHIAYGLAVLGNAYLSTAIATAFPPPRQSAAMPRFTSRRIIS